MAVAPTWAGVPGPQAPTLANQVLDAHCPGLGLRIQEMGVMPAPPCSSLLPRIQTVASPG